ncbi:MAG TPA: hypothetical protein PKL31_11765 [Fulvivirga sp.]|nr:hypothetical protein [Fulvivirga sp.]
MKIITTIGLLVAAGYGLNAQQHTETFKKELKFEKPTATSVLYIANVSGSIEVEGYDGDIIEVEAKRDIMAQSNTRLEEAKQLINVAVINRVDTLIVYTTQPCSTFGSVNENWRKHNSKKGSWGYMWNNQDKDCNYNIHSKVDYKIRVPRNANLMVSTINNGDISVSNIAGEVKAWNVNGAIAFEKVSNATFANTINGDVTLNFSTNPKNDGRFYSLNGDIRANYLNGISADMSFKSFNGDFYTNIPAIEQLPTKVNIEEAKKGKGIAYKLDGKSMMRARNGGVYIDFETFNGDVYVKEN